MQFSVKRQIRMYQYQRLAVIQFIGMRTAMRHVLTASDQYVFEESDAKAGYH